MATETARNQVRQMTTRRFPPACSVDEPHGTLVSGTPESEQQPARPTVNGRSSWGCRRQEPALRTAGPVSDSAAAKIRTQLSHQIMIAAMRTPRARKFAASCHSALRHRESPCAKRTCARLDYASDRLRG
jgi:hypothetical protein